MKTMLKSLVKNLLNRKETNSPYPTGDYWKFCLTICLCVPLFSSLVETKVVVKEVVRTPEFVIKKESEGAVKEVYSTLDRLEGSGDFVTDIPTGDLGVTESARKATGASKDTPGRLVALNYLKLLESKWGRVRGYKEAPPAVKRALIDSSYNMGEVVMTFPSVIKSLQEADYVGVVESLLDSANVGGESVKGLAKRRAELYNGVAEVDITTIIQREDGTILYKSGEKVLFSYKPEGGKHEKSKAGVVNIQPQPSVL